MFRANSPNYARMCHNRYLSVGRSVRMCVYVCVRFCSLRDVTTVSGIDVCVSLINLTFRDVCGGVEKRNTTEVAEKERQMKKKKTVMCQMYWYS